MLDCTFFYYSLITLIISLYQFGCPTHCYVIKRTVASDTESVQIVNAPHSHLDTLTALYIVPSELNEVFTLNQKSTFGNSYNKGWLMAADEYHSFNLYLYYSGTNLDALNQLIERPKSSNSTNNQRMLLLFTTENDCDNHSNGFREFHIVEKLAPNLFKALLNSVSLPHSDEPYYICLQQFDNPNYIHQGDDYWLAIQTTKSFLPSWMRIILFMMLLCLSGLFSGLNLGLMSLDLNELEILERIGTPQEQSFVKKIKPLRRRGNFLLCTILLGNVFVNAISTLILGDMLSGVYAAFSSTILIVIFGEIIPQSACSKHGLAVGAYTRYITMLFMVITCPLSYPISKILDAVLGQEISAQYNRDKIRELMKNLEDIDGKEFKMISGALDFNRKKVKEVMTNLDDVFMLERNASLDFETIAKIAQEGYSRIPVYEESRDNVVGLLHVKDFTLLDPDDNMPVKALLDYYNHKVIYCDSDKPIEEMFEEFRKGETHLAFVNEIVQPVDKDPYITCVGIVTMEDILEELIQMEIYDEMDDKQEIEKQIEKEEEEEKELMKSERRSSTSSSSTSSSSSSGSSTSSIHQKKKRKKSKDESSSSFKKKSLKDSLLPDDQSNLNNTNTINNSKSESESNKTNEKANELITTQTSSSLRAPRLDTQQSNDLSFFLQQPKDTAQYSLISPQIHFVMFQFLFTTVKPFTCEFLTKSVLELIFKKASLKETRRLDNKSPPAYLYQYGKVSNYFILILSGEATLEVGKEKLEFPAGPFAYFGMNALLSGCESAEQILKEDFDSSKKPYIPDFSLRVDDRCVYMKIDRDLWKSGVIKSRFEINKNRTTSKCEFNENSAFEPNHELIMKIEKQFSNLNSSKYDLKAESPRLNGSSHELNKQRKENENTLHPHSNNKSSIKNARRSTVAFNVLDKVQQSLAKNKEQHHGQIELIDLNKADAEQQASPAIEPKFSNPAEQEPLLNAPNNEY